MIRFELLLSTALVVALALPGAARAEGPAKPAAAEAKKAPREPEALFRTIGCRGCHGPGAPYHKNIVAAQTKDPKEIAGWILEPQKFKPGVQMPNYKGLITDEEAAGLARWIKEGNPK